MSNSNPSNSRHCVDAAIAFANAPQHGGSGYHLRVTLRSGELVEGAVSGFDNQHPDVLFLELPVDLNRETEVFLDKHDIVKAVVVW